MVHCRKMKMVPGVPRHVLVSYTSEPSNMVRLKEYIKANESIISLCSIFLGHPVHSASEWWGRKHFSKVWSAVEFYFCENRFYDFRKMLPPDALFFFLL